MPGNELIEQEGEALKSQPAVDKFETIELNPFNLGDGNSELNQAVLHALLAQIEHEPVIKLKRTVVLHKNTEAEQARKTYDVTVNDVNYQVTLTHSILFSNGIYYIYTHSIDDPEKYIVAQMNVNKHAEQADNPFSNCTVINITHKLELNNDLYFCKKLTNEAVEVIDKPIVAKTGQIDLEGKEPTPERVDRHREKLHTSLTNEQQAQVNIENYIASHPDNSDSNKFNEEPNTHSNILQRGEGAKVKFTMFMGFQPGINGAIWAYSTKEAVVSDIIRLEHARQIIRRLMQVQDAQYTHRDVKPGNFNVIDQREQNKDGRTVITKTGVKLLDFGTALRHGALNISNNVGTLRYAPPEHLWTHGRFTERSDVFSAAPTIAEQAFGADTESLFRHRIVNKDDQNQVDVTKPFDFSTIKYSGHRAIKLLLIKLLEVMSAPAKEGRPRLMECLAFFDTLIAYHEATINEKDAAFQKVLESANQINCLVNNLKNDDELKTEIEKVRLSHALNVRLYQPLLNPPQDKTIVSCQQWLNGLKQEMHSVDLNNQTTVSKILSAIIDYGTNTLREKLAIKKAFDKYIVNGGVPIDRVTDIKNLCQIIVTNINDDDAIIVAIENHLKTLVTGARSRCELANKINAVISKSHIVDPGSSSMQSNDELADKINASGMKSSRT